MNATHYSIRRATTNDSHDIESLHALLYADDPIHTEDVRTIAIARAIEHGLAWVAVSDQHIVGYALCEFLDVHHRYFPNSIFIDGLYILEPHRKQGIARHLIERIVNADYPAEYRSFSITHDPDETWLTSFYTSCGFTEIGKTDAGNIMMIKMRTPCS